MKKYIIAILIISVILVGFSFYLLFFTVKHSVLAESYVIHDNMFSTVIIDAGHGGADSGAVAGDGTLEKDLNLEIALLLKDYLESDGINVILTRDKDESIHDISADTLREQKVSDIHNRMKLMENTDDCIFVSIHQNSFTRSEYSGSQVFYTPDIPSGKLLAECIQKSVVNTLQKDNKRETKQCSDSVYLIYNAKKTAVLVECGFMTNKNELEKLKNKDYQKELSKAIGDGIIEYLKKGS